MRPYEERLSEAKSIYQAGLRKVETTPEPLGQKFPKGTRVKIAEDLGFGMDHFPGKGKLATVEYTYAHAFGGDDVKSYSLDIDDHGSVAWYLEHQLTAI